MEALKNNRPLPTTSNIARFNPFLKNSQIRLGGRLQFTSLSTDVRPPLLLEGNHPFVLLQIKNTHVRLHHLELESFFLNCVQISGFCEDAKL
ncbi:uncharacterized protein NPIL_671021 [Nephila pilipes]|uniref:Uncharacterized protein n=1 Tax=Nephila pilipes TaxID=299642 RepID=A0A8X6UBN5_NEPPI|nr:uncharacterized protein NPIL_624371 [Nephila pilipes]GFU01738.1 uncharacterized protein NPIL_671021 [Nephila pilipes]